MSGNAAPTADTRADLARLTGAGVSGGIIDSGYTASRARVRLSGGSGEAAEARWDDQIGHGTACAGIIARKAPDAAVYPIKIFEDELVSDTGKRVAGIRWGCEQGLDVLNLSLGTTDLSAADEMRGACREAAEQGVRVVAATANDGRESVPADSTSTTTVVSDTIWNNDGMAVADGNLFDVWTTAGSIAAVDADGAREGLQVAAANGVLRFEFRAGALALPAEISAVSVAGKATGHTTLELTDSAAPATPSILTAAWQESALVVSWQSGPETDLAGYMIHYSASTPGPPFYGMAAPPGEASPFAVGADTTARIVGLDPAQSWYVALSAFDVAGNESAVSTAVAAGAAPAAALPGDFDGNGAVDFDDFFVLVDHFGQVEGDAGYDAAIDLAPNGVIDFDDFFVFVDHFGSEGQSKLLALARQHLGLPGRARLEGSYPNPFNACTVIRFAMPRRGVATLTVQNVVGQPVRRLVSGPVEAGAHAVAWDGRDDAGRALASGVYVCRLRTRTGEEVQRMLMLR